MYNFQFVSYLSHLPTFVSEHMYLDDHQYIIFLPY